MTPRFHLSNAVVCWREDSLLYIRTPNATAVLNVDESRQLALFLLSEANEAAAVDAEVLVSCHCREPRDCRSTAAEKQTQGRGPDNPR